MHTAAGGPFSEDAWLDVLEREAQRDLVFLWHIAQSRFGGPSYPAAEVPFAVDRVSCALLERGCKLGFGDPDSPSWHVPVELSGTPQEQGALLAAAWQQNPEKWQFLVFARR